MPADLLDICVWIAGNLVGRFLSFQKKPAGFLRKVSIALAAVGKHSWELLRDLWVPQLQRSHLCVRPRGLRYSVVQNPWHSKPTNYYWEIAFVSGTRWIHMPVVTQEINGRTQKVILLPSSSVLNDKIYLFLRVLYGDIYSCLWFTVYLEWNLTLLFIISNLGQ